MCPSDACAGKRNCSNMISSCMLTCNVAACSCKLWCATRCIHDCSPARPAQRTAAAVHPLVVAAELPPSVPALLTVTAQPAGPAEQTVPSCCTHAGCTCCCTVMAAATVLPPVAPVLLAAHLLAATRNCCSCSTVPASKLKKVYSLEPMPAAGIRSTILLVLNCILSCSLLLQVGLHLHAAVSFVAHYLSCPW